MSQAPVALVTGASRGIGRGIAVALAREGFSVAINYASNRDAAEEARAACEEAVKDRSHGGGEGVEPARSGEAGEAGESAGVHRGVAGEETHPNRQHFELVQGNVGVREDRERILREVTEAYGYIDALVNNAGIAPRERNDILEATEDSFEELMRVNLHGPYFLTQAVARRWVKEKLTPRIESGFKIVFVGSISADTVSLNRGEYCVSKAGAAMASKLWAVRLATENVQVYEVRPGITATDMTAGVREKYDRLIEEGLVPQRRWGTPEDNGKAVASLVRGDFPFSSGEVINVDGAFHISRL